MTVSLEAKILQKIERNLSGGKPALKRALQKAGNIHLAYLQDRWNAGGFGEWPGLTLERKERKRKNHNQILIEFEDLFNSMTVFVSEYNAKVGFNEDEEHPSGKTTRQLAGYHHRGEGWNPARKIIVPMDDERKERAKSIIKEGLIRTMVGES